MFARIRKIIDLSKLSLKEEKVPAVQAVPAVPNNEGGASGSAKEAGRHAGQKEMPMKEKIVMIHILRNWMMTPRSTKIVNITKSTRSYKERTGMFPPLKISVVLLFQWLFRSSLVPSIRERLHNEVESGQDTFVRVSDDPGDINNLMQLWDADRLHHT